MRLFSPVFRSPDKLYRGIVNATDFKIGFVDMDRAANDSEEGEKALDELKGYMEANQTAIDERGKAIEQMKSDLERGSAFMSGESKMDDLERAERDLQRMATVANQDLEIKRNELTASVFKGILEIIRKMGQEQKYSIILPVQSLLYGDKALDITDIVIKKSTNRKGQCR